MSDASTSPQPAICARLRNVSDAGYVGGITVSSPVLITSTPSFAPHPAKSRATHVGAGTGHRARARNYTLNITSVDPPSGSSLDTCDLASHATLRSCRSRCPRAASRDRFRPDAAAREAEAGLARLLVLQAGAGALGPSGDSVATEQLHQLLVRAASLSLRNREAEASRTLRLGQLPAPSRSRHVPLLPVVSELPVPTWF